MRTNDGEPIDTDQAARLDVLATADTSEVDTVATIVVEVRDSAGAASAAEIRKLLIDRLQESSVQLPDGDIDELVRQIRIGDEGA